MMAVDGHFGISLMLDAHTFTTNVLHAHILYKKCFKCLFVRVDAICPC